jgi:hypothetical protein
MSSVVIQGDVSGAATLTAPSAAGSPTLTLPTTTGTIALTSNINALAIGVDQTWQNLTASRVVGTTYTNSTGRPIAVSIYASTTNPGGRLTVDGITVSYQYIASGTAGAAGPSAIIPNGSTYVYNGGNNNTVTVWAELR